MKIAKVAALGLLLAAGLSGMARANVVLELWDSQSPIREPLQRQVIAEFERLNPGIKVQFTPLPYGEMPDKLLTAIAGGRAPDVVRHSYASSWGYRGVAEPLDAYMAADDVDLKQFHPLALGPTRQWNGSTWGLPFNLALNVVFYNKDLFAGSGIASSPSDWNELANYAKKLTRVGANGPVSVYGFSTFVLDDFLAGNGAPQLLEPNSQLARETNFADPKVIEAGEFLLDLHRNRTGKPFPAWGSQEMEKGQLAMWLGNSNWMETALTTPALGVDIGVFLLPPKRAGTIRPVTGHASDAVMVIRESKQKQAAWKLARFYASRFGTATIWRGMYGMLPPYKDVLQQPLATPAYQPFNQDPFLRNLARLALSAPARPLEFEQFHVLRNELTQVWNDAWTAAASGKMALGIALQEADRQGDAMLQRFLSESK